MSLKSPVKPLGCFIVMPFRAELNFLFLYLKDYLFREHHLHVERGDHQIRTMPLLEKVRAQIRLADVIIGDVTGKNPNVFYELGLADAYGKHIILITQDTLNDVPADIRHLELIFYDLAKHDELLNKLDNAIQNVLYSKEYEKYHKPAINLLKTFNSETGSLYTPTTMERFQIRVKHGESSQMIPDDPESYHYAAFFLPKILKSTDDASIMLKVTNWLSNSFEGQKKI